MIYIFYTGVSDGSPYEKRVDAKGCVLSDECIADEVPFEKLPEGWAWARLSSICQVKGGKRIPAGRKLSITPTGQKYIRVSDMQNGTVLENDTHYVPEDLIDVLSRYTVSSNDVYITVAGTIGRIGIIPDSFNGANLTENADKLVFYLSLDKKWFYYLLSSMPIQSLIVGATTQVGQPKLAIKRIESFLLPIPPLAEQHRIVERINQLMPLVEEYGELEDTRQELDAALPDRLRKSVLQMAVQGKLVEQNPDDEPASALLQRICKERANLVAEGKAKFPKGGESVIYTGSDGRHYEKRIDKKGRILSNECIENEIPFEIPDSWEWIRLGSLIFNRGQKKPKSRFSYIDIASVDNKNQRLGKDTILEATDAPSRARKVVAKGDILYSTVRPYLHNVCIIDRDFKYEPIASTGFAVLACPHEFLPSFLLYYLVSPCFDEYANSSENSKGVAYPAINDSRLYKALVPVPPFTEQERIIQRLLTLE